MNTPKEFKHDPIGRYLNSEMAEKAPSGFTENVMSRVILEARPLKSDRKNQRSYVPLISLAVILILTGVAFALPSEGGFLQMPWMNFFHSTQLPALKINLDSLLGFRLPWYLPYLFISILLLSVFDRALSGIFHKEKKQQAPER